MKDKLVKLRLNTSGKILKNLSTLQDTEWLNKNQVKSIQQRRLTDLVKYAHENVPYYRENLPFHSIINNDGLIDFSQLSKIPILTKSIIRNHFEELKSEKLDAMNWYQNTSGGSTGEPILFIQHKEVKEWEQSVKLLFDEWSGKSIGEKQIRLWGSQRDLLVGNENLRSKFGKWMRNEVWLNAFSLSDERMLDYVDQINSIKPVQILAYAESIYELSVFIEEHKLKVHSPKSIMTSAGTLYPHMREVIERVFKTKVFNRYGSREVGDIACECNHHNGLHISSLTHYVEILKSDHSPADKGEMGEIIVTPLMNFGMPLIRYKIGDMGKWAEEECSCGRGLPLLKEVSGRVTDTFITKEKKPIYGAYFAMLFYHKDWIKKFQIIQEDYELIKLSLVLKNQYVMNPFEVYSEEISKITKDIKDVMGPNCDVSFDFLQKIESSPSGKHRALISKVKRD
ncbi:hypothetical protein SM124_01645 [Bacillus sp. 31A1R]|uniref:Phenylacetate-CoA ligase n=1 Tax=Robertmurraya mangrovi TaxID=3098077 RepID=A0ABU5ITI3_9BACI|nr:hypothetical protein [Bacillus sp. 31A1R]MDZ5470441.1 hypothetical protein [Bacillus sp. 31A1R]